jgi:hypothetical protein
VASLPFAALYLLALAHLRLPVLLAGAALATVGWFSLVRGLRLLARNEVPLLHESNQGPVRFALRYLAPTGK